MNRFYLFVLCVLCVCACNRKAEEPEFWLGADIGWCTEYEANGWKFYNKEGQERECTALMKELGLNAVRHRVWVDPSKHGNWCDKADLLVKCQRAKALDMEILLDFHYSDWWADPNKQNIPASWSGHSYEQMMEDLKAHTVDVLQMLKDNDVEPKWIQVGNETRNGFLWSVKSNELGWPVLDENGNATITESMGHAKANPEQYAGLFAAGYDACKSVFPDAIVMVHLDNGYDRELYDWNLGVLKENGAKWDMIGMSLYPYWALDSKARWDEDKVIDECIENIRYVGKKFDSDIMIVETGFIVDEENPARLEKSKRQLARVIRESINNTDGRCKGVFYWEPECKPSQYKLGAFTEDGYPTVIMDAFSDWSDEYSRVRVEAQPSPIKTVGNPYLPMWEHIPDGEPYVFEDPENPGKYRAYIYGSHDSRLTEYCGREIVVWSAPVENLNEWRYDGEIFSVSKTAAGENLAPGGIQDVLFAPDMALVTDADGNKTYYLYPNNQEGGRQSMVAKSSRPDGPFEVCNWSADDPKQTEGILRFDPAVFVDDDGRVYGYWGFDLSYGAELDPSTMATLKPGTQIKEGLIGGRREDPFRFFEASSMRKIKDKYVLIYSRWTKRGEFGLPGTNYTLAYAYSDNPLGPFTYGGTIIDGRGREIDENGNVIASAVVTGNTHGSICEINGQWYVFYHRQTGLNEYTRQAMVAPITVSVEEGKGGKVMISEGEYNSEGFSLGGLDPLEPHSAGIACWHTGPTVAIHAVKKIYSGSYVEAGFGTSDKYEAPYALHNNTNVVVNNTDGSIVGYKYFNFSKTAGCKNLSLYLKILPMGIDGTITVMLDRPWVSQGGKVIGTIDIDSNMPKRDIEVAADVPALAEVEGKHALYLVFSSPVEGKSICSLKELVFR